MNTRSRNRAVLRPKVQVSFPNDRGLGSWLSSALSRASQSVRRFTVAHGADVASIAAGVAQGGSIQAGGYSIPIGQEAQSIMQSASPFLSMLFGGGQQQQPQQLPTPPIVPSQQQRPIYGYGPQGGGVNVGKVLLLGGGAIAALWVVARLTRR